MSNTTDLSTIIVFILYLIAVLAIGIWAYRKNSDMSDFAIGGRRLGTFVTTVSAKATDSSQWVFFGLPGAFYISGMRDVWLIIGLTLGFYLSWKLLAGRLRVYSSKISDWRQEEPGESVTLPGFFANRFRSNSLRSVSAIFIIIFYVIYLGSAFIATGVIFQQLFGGSIVWGTIFGAVVVMVYSSLGGYLASSYTDLVQGFLMWGSIMAVSVAAIVNLGGVGGFIEVIGAQNPDLGSPFASVEFIGGEWTTTASLPIIAIISSLAWAVGYFGSPHILARFMGMRKAESARGGARLGVFLSITLLGSAGVVGFAAIAIFGPELSNPEDAYMALVSELFPSWVAGVFLAGVLSAVMSTADSQLVVASTTLTEDFYRAFINHDAPQKTLVWLSRLAVLACTGIGIIVALRGGTILDLVGYAWAGFGASFGPALLAALYWRRATWFGVLLSIVVGGGTVIVYRMVDTIGLYELVPGFIAGLLALWLGSWLGPKQPEVVMKKFDELKAQCSTSTINSVQNPSPYEGVKVMPTVDVAIEDTIGVITLNNPRALNAWTQQMQRDMTRVLNELDQDSAVEGIVITGTGERAFCAGQDLNEVADFSEDHVEDWLDHFRRVYDAVLSNSKPVIAALNGVTAGSGYQLALLCDMRIAHSKVRIGQPEVRSGIPSITGMYLTWQSVGHSKTAEMMLTGRLLEAQEAANLGLIAEILPQEEVLQRSIAIAKELAALPKQAFALTKQRIRATLMPGLEEAFAAALDADKQAYGDGEPQRTAGDFVTKRGA